MINILIKAMLALPFPDFKLCLSLLGEAPVQQDYSPLIARTAKDVQQGQEGEEGAKKEATPTEADAESSTEKTFLAGNITDPLILRLANLSNLLSTARFRQFWSTLYEEDNEDVRKFTDNVAGFEEDVRKIVMDTVASTFQRISEERLASYLHLKAGSELREYVGGFKEEGWSVQEDKKMIVAPVNADNEIKAVTINEEISLDRELRYDVLIRNFLLILGIFSSSELSRFLQQAQPTPLRAPTNSGAPAPTAVSS